MTQICNYSHPVFYNFYIGGFIECGIRTVPSKEEVNMPSFKCKDIGMKCSFEIKDEDRDELMSEVALHAEKTHGMKTIPPDLAAKVEKAIKK